MRPHRTVRLAALATTASALVLIALVVDSTPYVLVAGAAVAATSLVAAARMWRCHCPESRLLASITVLTAAAGALIVTTVGLPGEAARPLDGGAVALVCLGLAVPALLAADRLRRAAAPTASSPYAL
ncbi:hypothetical protein ACHAAC_02880 [Aeromicrobium sp. CF4.19]|uniref:hypothetical protein n=1 Tax=Aeromicrobium sp. CF4.19 TaxID=3373082 RepID=UPI003EE67EE6